MPRIISRKNNLYISYYSKYRKRGVLKSIKLKDTPSNRVKARKILKQFEAKLVLDADFDKAPRTDLKLEEAFKYFEYEKQEEIKDSTLYLYKIAVKHLVAAAGNKLLKVYNENDDRKLKKYFDEIELNGSGNDKKKGLRQNSKAIYIIHLRSLWNYFIKKEFAVKHFLKPVKKENKRIRLIPPEDSKLILDYAKKHNRDQYNFLLFVHLTGVRVSDAINLKWSDIEKERIVISNVKKDRPYYFPMTEKLTECLSEIPKKSEYVFQYKDKNSLKFFNRIQNSEQLKGKLQNRYTWHEWRKTFASKLINSGVDIVFAAALLGHKDIRTTRQYYVQLDMNSLKEQVDKIDKL